MARLSIKGDPRSERIAVLITTTTKKNLEKVAAVNRVSVNLLINNLITEHLEKHQDDIDRYNAFFGEE